MHPLYYDNTFLSCLSILRSFEAESVEHTRIQTELERAHEEFKSFERKDIKLREDIKHLKTKGKKLKDKLQKDAAKAQVINPILFQPSFNKV